MLAQIRQGLSLRELGSDDLLQAVKGTECPGDIPVDQRLDRQIELDMRDQIDPAVPGLCEAQCRCRPGRMAGDRKLPRRQCG